MMPDSKVHTTVSQLGGHKAPALDGFSGLFYQQNWQVVSPSLCSAIHSFLFLQDFCLRNLTEPIFSLFLSAATLPIFTRFVLLVNTILCIKLFSKLLSIG